MEKVAHLAPDADAVTVAASAWTVDQLQGPFLAYGLCLAMASAAFLAELATAVVVWCHVRWRSKAEAAGAGGSNASRVSSRHSYSASMDLFRDWMAERRQQRFGVGFGADGDAIVGIHGADSVGGANSVGAVNGANSVGGVKSVKSVGGVKGAGGADGGAGVAGVAKRRRDLVRERWRRLAVTHF